MILMKLQRLKELRLENEYSQSDLAKILKVQRGTYASWECGSDMIPTLQLYNIAEFFGISTDYILNIENTLKKVNCNKDLNLTIIGERLNKIREDNKLSQAKIADSININQSTWWAYEKGKTLITTHSLIELNKVYDYSIDYILGRID